MRLHQLDLRTKFQEAIREATGITIQTSDLPLTGHIQWQQGGLLEIDGSMVNFPLTVVWDFDPEEQTQIMLARVQDAQEKRLDTLPPEYYDSLALCSDPKP